MPPLEAADVARLLAEMGERSALVEDTPYRSRAYLRAARNLAGLTVPLYEVIAAGRLKQIPGVGDAIARVIAAPQRTGSHPALEALRAEAPYSLVELVSVPGLGSGLIMNSIGNSEGERSHWHRIDAAEVWVWLAGAPLLLEVHGIGMSGLFQPGTAPYTKR